MKALTIALSVIAALLIALIAVFLLGGALGVDVSVTTLPAAQDALNFAAAVESVQGGACSATFAAMESEDAADHTVTAVTVTFTNSGIFDAEWLTFEVVPGAGDVALWSQSAEVVDVPARSREALTLSLLSRADVPVAGRTLEVEYYVLGMRRTMSVPIDG